MKKAVCLLVALFTAAALFAADEKKAEGEKQEEKPPAPMDKGIIDRTDSAGSKGYRVVYTAKPESGKTWGEQKSIPFAKFKKDGKDVKFIGNVTSGMDITVVFEDAPKKKVKQVYIGSDARNIDDQGNLKKPEAPKKPAPPKKK